MKNERLPPESGRKVFFGPTHPPPPIHLHHHHQAAFFFISEERTFFSLFNIFLSFIARRSKLIHLRRSGPGFKRSIQSVFPGAGEPSPGNLKISRVNREKENGKYAEQITFLIRLCRKRPPGKVREHPPGGGGEPLKIPSCFTGERGR